MASIEASDDGRSAEDRMLESVNVINEMFGLDATVPDPLWDKWEAELEEGIIPDLDEMP